MHETDEAKTKAKICHAKFIVRPAHSISINYGLHVYCASFLFLEQWNTIVGLQSARTNHLQDRARINKARTASQDKSGVIAGIVALHATERVAT